VCPSVKSVAIDWFKDTNPTMKLGLVTLGDQGCKYYARDMSIPLWLGGRLHMMLRLTRTISRGEFIRCRRRRGRLGADHPHHRWVAAANDRACAPPPPPSHRHR
ncbi:hypothetical protein ACJX0J_027254, partial [Zea mays]